MICDSTLNVIVFGNVDTSERFKFFMLSRVGHGIFLQPRSQERNHTYLSLHSEPRHDKTCLLGFRLGPAQPGCAVTEDGLRLEISDSRYRGIVLYM